MLDTGSDSFREALNNSHVRARDRFSFVAIVLYRRLAVPLASDVLPRKVVAVIVFMEFRGTEMYTQQIGYYSQRQNKVLDTFDRTAALMSASLAERYGTETAEALKREVRDELEKLIPEIPHISGGQRAGSFNHFLRITAQELAVFKAMRKRGKSAREAWEICHEAIRLGAEQVPLWKRHLIKRLMFSWVVKKLFEKREKKGAYGKFGDFEVEYLAGNSAEYDFGVNYLGCGNIEFVKKHGGEEFAPYICLSDIALSDAMGWGLKRTQTLADGRNYCDFRFKKGAKTQISSKTKEVQETIDIIKAREEEQVAVSGVRSPRD
ncbi:MAG: L-2-amino-thiazoline-4-carboxylic acid hydrolase [Ectothiorhodospiraceae bacterium]|nr:L-2-amino-thiazoline-4-carboxylic acid hydrolase [Ectothiorhodospiraceae bacterium]MCH8503329.1 L-2-amino-thiazoline-4-carboxylic acid hydrolase [Ectothiorhodospiraceae bacterium]